MKKVLAVLGVLILIGGAWAASADLPQPVGIVKIATQGMVLKVKVGKNPVTKKPNEVPISSAQEAQMPPGRYDVAAVELYKPDDARTIWRIVAENDLGKLRSFEVASGETATLEGGEVLKIKTTVSMKTGKASVLIRPGKPAGPPPPPEKTVTVYVDYVGQAGECYAPKVMKGRVPAAPPVLRLVDYDGKVLSEGKYQFGTSGFG